MGANYKYIIPPNLHCLLLTPLSCEQQLPFAPLIPFSTKFWPFLEDIWPSLPVQRVAFPSIWHCAISQSSSIKSLNSWTAAEDELVETPDSRALGPGWERERRFWRANKSEEGDGMAAEADDEEEAETSSLKWNDVGNGLIEWKLT